MNHINKRNVILNSVLLVLLLVSHSAAAVLYRGVDAEGKVVYSDMPFEDAEKFTPPPISVVDSPNKEDAEADGAAENKKKPAEFKYLDFDIVSPTNKQTIRNQQNVSVSLKLNPGLNTDKEHTIWLMMDKKPVVKESLSTALQIDKVDRGAHQLQAEVRDAEGKIIVRTRPIVFFMHK